MSDAKNDKENAANDKILLVNLVTMLGTSALQQLGRIPDPVSKKTQVNIQGAQMIIDMLDMFERKTKGNLDTEEEKIVRETLSSLKLTFVELAKEAESDNKQGDKQREEPAAEPEQATPEPEKNEDKESSATDDSKDPKEKKYHKSYG